MNHSKGFISVVFLVIIVLVISAGVSAYFYLQSEEEDGDQKSGEQQVAVESPIVAQKATPAPIPAVQQSIPMSVPALTLTPILAVSPQAVPISTPTLTPISTFTPIPLPPPSCESNSSPVFTSHITDMSKVNYVVSPPTMGAGPNLKTHSYIGTDHARVPVYAPAAMALESGAHYIGGPYTINFKASCEVKIRFGHITEPVDAIKNLLPSEPKEGSNTQELFPIKFEAGDLIAYTTGTSQAGNWDFGVYNSTVSNRYANDSDWSWSDTFTTAVCSFEYFSDDLKSAYVSKFNSTILGGNPPHGEAFCNVSTGSGY